VAGHAGFDSKKVWASICDAVVKSIIAVQPILAQAYAQCQLRPSTVEEAADLPFRCFELLGYDFLLDAAGRPWLLEVNHSPSFHIDTPMDRVVKIPLIRETLQLARADPKAVAKAQTVCFSLELSPGASPAFV
jgi:tubulin polyglutamylase TTLL6/13